MLIQLVLLCGTLAVSTAFVQVSYLYISSRFPTSGTLQISMSLFDGDNSKVFLLSSSFKSGLLVLV